MWEMLLQVDSDLALAINQTHSAWADPIMVFFSEKWVWLPMYAYLLWVFLRPLSDWRSRFYLLMAIAFGVALSDQTASALLKPLTERLRPCHDPDLSALLHLPEGCGGKFGFASSHAANTAFLAMFFFLIRGKAWPKLAIWLAIWAFLTGYSRIYLGAHFPGDVLAGFGIGAIWAEILFRILRNLLPAVPSS
jgi:undecaprenyl-diphosphatase